MPVTQLPFAAFIPDGSAYGQDLDRFENVLPINRGARPLQRLGRVASVKDGPMLGAFIHIFQAVLTEQFGRPDADTSAGQWLPDSGTTLYSQIDEESPSDGEYIYCAGAPVAQVAKVSLSDLTTPAAGTQKLRWRYAVAGYAATSASITSITRSGATATATTATAHGLTTGDYAFHAGATQTEYNGAFQVTVLNSTQYTFTVMGTPATPATGTITWQRAWTVKIELVEGATVRATDIVAGGADAAFAQRETTPAPAVGTWSNLFFQFTATVPGSAVFLRPISDDTLGGFTTDSGGTSSLFAAIDEEVASDVDFVQSEVLAVGATRAYVVNLTAPTSQPFVDTAHTVRYRYRGTNGGVNLVVTLLQGTTVVASQTHTDTATSIAAGSIALDSSQRAALKASGYANLKLKFEVSRPAASTSTTFQHARPASDTGSSGWQTQSGGTTNLFATIDEASPDDADFIVAASTTNNSCEIALNAVVDPLATSGYTLRVRAKSPAVGKSLLVRLRSGLTLVKEWDLGVITSSFVTYSVALSASEIANVINHSSLALVLISYGTSQGAGVAVSWADFEVPEVRREVVSWAELELPSAARAEVSWAEYRAPTSDSVYRGDQPTRFCGSRTKLFVFDGTGFTDISKGGGYGASSTVPGGWYFCAYGNDVIATNFADAVQYRADNTGNFADLITSVEKPKARFCCPARGTLLLGGINHTGHFADELWWSAIEDNRDFDPAAATTGSDFQRLVATPGQLMGLVGGNDPFVFKRRSLYQLAWVGDIEVFVPNLLSDSIGTPFPRSIVQGQGEVFFWGGESFYRLPIAPGAVPRALGKGILSRYLTDSLYSDGAIRQLSPDGMKEEDQIMVGAWDPHAGVVVWTYQGNGDSEWQHSRAVVYNPEEDRWSTWHLPGANISALFTLPNTIDDSVHQLKGIVGLDWDANESRWFRFDGSTTYEVTSRSKIFPIAMEQDGRPKRVRLKGVLPLFTVNQLAVNPPPWPDVTIQVEAGDDPRFVISPETETYTRDASADARQWFPFDLEGYFFRLTVTVPTMSRQIMRSLDTLYLDWEVRGT